MVSRSLTPFFLDTSYVIALFNLDDEFHGRARRWHVELRRTRRGLVTTASILTEIGDGFASHNRWPLARAFLDVVCSDPLITVVPVDCDLIERALELKRRRPDKDWGLTDCLSFVVMQERALREALSADSDFAQAGFRALLLDR
ncbi:MAG TPA: PIN domain-containing protein [Dehalococcoidia bacterium]|nr:PIN domain-containing protein [Dehalococcoidia bacterium]